MKAKKAEEHWKPENRPSWQLHSELGPNVGAQASIVRKETAPELVNPADHDWWTSPLWKDFSHRSAQEFWESLKVADETYTNQELDMTTLNDDDQMLFVHLVLEHAKYTIRCIEEGVEPKAKQILLLGTAGSGKNACHANCVARAPTVP